MTVATLMNYGDFAHIILSGTHNLDREARETFREICAESWDSYYRQSKVVPLSEAKELLDGQPNNWLYDRASGLVWIDLQGGQHLPMCSALYCIRRGFTHIERYSGLNQDSFLKEGYGMFCSSVGDYAFRGMYFAMTPQEKIVFRNQDIRTFENNC